MIEKKMASEDETSSHLIDYEMEQSKLNTMH